MIKDPQSPEEWQEAVNLAHMWRMVEAARLFGLVTGGPKVNVARCDEIIERGKKHGIKPQDAVVGQMIAAHAQNIEQPPMDADA